MQGWCGHRDGFCHPRLSFPPAGLRHRTSRRAPAPRWSPHRASHVPPTPLLCLHPKASVPPTPGTTAPGHHRCRPPTPPALRGRFPREILERSTAGGRPRCCACGLGGSEGGRGGGRAALRKGGDPCRPARRPGWWESLGTRRCSPWKCRRWGPPRPWPAASDSPPAPRGPPAPGCRPWRSPAR